MTKQEEIEAKEQDIKDRRESLNNDMGALRNAMEWVARDYGELQKLEEELVELKNEK